MKKLSNIMKNPENDVNKLCSLTRKAQKLLGLSAMINTITINFPTAENFVFRKFSFFDRFFMDF